MINAKTRRCGEATGLTFKRHGLARYGGALAAVGVGMLVRLTLTAWFGPGLPTYITFYPAVMAVALLGGLGPGLLATAATALVTDYWLLPPNGFGIERAIDGVGLAFFASMGVFMSVVAELYRRARLKAEAYDQELALREARREKEFLAGIIEHSSQAFGMGYPDGRLGRINRAFERLTGYSAAELRGLDWAKTLTPPEWQELERQKLAELHATGQPVRYEKEYLRKDGTRVPIELVVDLARDGEGKPEYYYSFITDITERKRAEESQARLAAIVQSSDDAILSKDVVGLITSWNAGAERLFGYQSQEVIGRSIRLLLPPDRQEEEDQIMARLQAGKRVEHFETIRLAKDGRSLAVSVTSSPLTDGGGHIIGASKIIRDITERKQAAEATQRLNTSLEQRVAELQAANEAVQASRRAALSLAEDALEARKEAERVNTNLQQANEALDASRRAALNLMNDAVRARIEAEQAGADARRAAEHRRLALEAADLGSWEYHFQTGAVFWDERCREMWGIPQHEQIEYAQAIAAIHPEDRAGVDEAVKQALAGKSGGAYHREFRVVWPDGSVHWIASHGRVYFQGEGEERHAIRFVGANLDVTWEKQAEQALRESEERFRTMANAMPQLAWIARGDGHIYWYNQGWYDYTGTTPAQMEGWGWQSVHDPAVLPKVLERWRASLAAGQPFEMEFPLRGADGRFRPFLTRGVPLKDAAGRVVQWLGTNTDITEQKHAEEELQRLNRILRARSQSDQALVHAKAEAEYLEAVCRIVVEDCGHAMVWVGLAEEDGSGTVRPVAQAGFEEGYLDTLRITWTDTERGRGPTGTAIRTGQPCMCRNMLTDPKFAPWREEALKRGYASSLVLPLLADGKAFGALTIYSRKPDGFSEDEVRLLGELAGDLAFGITALRLRAAKEQAEAELRQSAEDLQRSNRDLEQFAYVASHDLQEPLRAVGGYVKLLQHRFPDKLDAKAREYVAGAFEGATRMERLISDLLAFSRVGTRGGNFAPADLESVLAYALGNLEVGIKSAHAAVTHDALPTLPVDSTQIMQLFQNLIGNALKFHGESPPRIHVGARRAEGRWVFSVRDNGIGIEPQYYEKIFHIFQRLHTRKDYSGTGIGLAICKKIVERHGGTIWVESQPGQGSTFCFSIPAGPESEAGADAHS